MPATVKSFASRLYGLSVHQRNDKEQNASAFRIGKGAVTLWIRFRSERN